MKKSVLTSVVALMAALTIAGPNLAFGTHTPANKAIASGSKVVKAAPLAEVDLLTATMRTSKTTDLLLEVNLECSILTSLITGGENAETSTAEAEALVWVEIDEKIV